MTQVLSKAANALAARALGDAMAAGSVEICDASGVGLIKFDLPESFTYDDTTSVVQFDAPPKSEVARMGFPDHFRLLSKSGELLLTGSAGQGSSASPVDLAIPAKKFFVGMEVTIGPVAYRMRLRT